MPDGTTTNTWVGEWFPAEVGNYYKIPDNAAQYSEFRGLTALCSEVRTSSFGMHWAYLVGPVTDRGQARGWVRTCYLDPKPVT
jgi:hypothetical protein